MVVLDTDHPSFLERGDDALGQRLRGRLASLSPGEAATTIISFEEQARGWMAQMARARSLPRQVEIYRRLKRQLDNYRKLVVLEFDDTAAVEFQRLRAGRIRIGTYDLKIAAIVMAHDATLLSRNLVDFRKVAGLKVEDWTL
jgi:tRNA(fMet)-specific endonuclease VapC